MSLTFDSRSIKRVVLLDHLDALSPPESQLLKEELTKAIDSMEVYLGNIAHEKFLAGDTHNQDWQIRIRRKQEVCRVFLDKMQTLDHDLSSNNQFRKLYDKHFRWLLLEVMTEERYEQIRCQAIKLASKELM
jgi:hypothetical protein